MAKKLPLLLIYMFRWDMSDTPCELSYPASVNTPPGRRWPQPSPERPAQPLGLRQLEGLRPKDRNFPSGDQAVSPRTNEPRGPRNPSILGERAQAGRRRTSAEEGPYDPSERHVGIWWKRCAGMRQDSSGGSADAMLLPSTPQHPRFRLTNLPRRLRGSKP